MNTIFYQPELTMEDVIDIRTALGLIADYYRKIVDEAKAKGNECGDTTLMERAAAYEACANKLRGLPVSRIDEKAL